MTKQELDAIRERVHLPWSHEGSDPMPPLEQCSEDRATLLAEVDRLTEVLEDISGKAERLSNYLEAYTEGIDIHEVEKANKQMSIPRHNHI